MSDESDRQYLRAQVENRFNGFPEEAKKDLDKYAEAMYWKGHREAYNECLKLWDMLEPWKKEWEEDTVGKFLDEIPISVAAMDLINWRIEHGKSEGKKEALTTFERLDRKPVLIFIRNTNGCFTRLGERYQRSLVATFGESVQLYTGLEDMSYHLDDQQTIVTAPLDKVVEWGLGINKNLNIFLCNLENGTDDEALIIEIYDGYRP